MFSVDTVRFPGKVSISSELTVGLTSLRLKKCHQVLLLFLTVITLTHVVTRFELDTNWKSSVHHGNSATSSLCDVTKLVMMT